MVFLLEDLAKIEQDRGVHLIYISEEDVHVQSSNDILRDSRTPGVINDTLEPFIVNAGYYCWGVVLPPILSVFTDAFLNAGMWGNRNVIGKKITTTFKYGSYGGVICIRDEGEGFDFRGQIDKIKKGETHIYGHNGGGLRKFSQSPLFISYHGVGNLISIATPVFSKQEFLDFMSRRAS